MRKAVLPLGDKQIHGYESAYSENWLYSFAAAASDLLVLSLMKCNGEKSGKSQTRIWHIYLINYSKHQCQQLLPFVQAGYTFSIFSATYKWCQIKSLKTVTSHDSEEHTKELGHFNFPTQVVARSTFIQYAFWKNFQRWLGFTEHSQLECFHVSSWWEAMCFPAAVMLSFALWRPTWKSTFPQMYCTFRFPYLCYQWTFSRKKPSLFLNLWVQNLPQGFWIFG